MHVTMRVPLPDDQWAEIRDADDLTGEDEVKVRSAVKLTGAAQGEEARMTATAAATTLMEFAMLARVITSWSLPQPINAANIAGLKLSQLRPLKKAIEAHMEELRDDPNSLSGSETGSAS
jgi:hypothetical protein